METDDEFDRWFEPPEEENEGNKIYLSGDGDEPELGTRRKAEDAFQGLALAMRMAGYEMRLRWEDTWLDIFRLCIHGEWEEHAQCGQCFQTWDWDEATLWRFRTEAIKILTTSEKPEPQIFAWFSAADPGAKGLTEEEFRAVLWAEALAA